MVLGFVARRLYADRVAIILTIGDEHEPSAFVQLPTIDVGGLPDDAAADLLRSIAGVPLEAAVVDRVLTGTDRNPLAIVEVGNDFTADELAAWAYLPGARPDREKTPAAIPPPAAPTAETRPGVRAASRGRHLRSPQPGSGGCRRRGHRPRHGRARSGSG